LIEERGEIILPRIKTPDSIYVGNTPTTELRYGDAVNFIERVKELCRDARIIFFFGQRSAGATLGDAKMPRVIKTVDANDARNRQPGCGEMFVRKRIFLKIL
jgi:hypothetical protein